MMSGQFLFDQVLRPFQFTDHGLIPLVRGLKAALFRAVNPIVAHDFEEFTTGTAMRKKIRPAVFRNVLDTESNSYASRRISS
jgi:hypothetical protein